MRSTVRILEREAPDRARMPYLDGLRGGAALWVLLAHCMIWSGCPGRYIPDPKIAVDLFIVLSGYLMLRLWPVPPGSTPEAAAVSARQFWVRRFFRIAPVYYLALGMAFLLGDRFLSGYAALHTGARWEGDGVYGPALIRFTPLNALMHVTFLFGLFPRWSFSTMLPDWSIGLEMQFYALFPFLIGRMRRHGALTVACASAILCAATTELTSQWPPIRSGAPPGYPEASLLLLKLPIFMVGMLAAEAVRVDRLERAECLKLSLAALVLAAVFAHPLVSAAAALLLYVGMAPDTAAAGAANRLLGNRMAAFLAAMSYPVYLTHGFFIAFAGGCLQGQSWFIPLPVPYQFALLTGCVVLATYATAYVVHHLVERPGVALGRQSSQLPVFQLPP